MRKGFRKGKEDEHLKKVVEEGHMSEWEMDQILRQREASTINPKSIEYRIVLENDDLRKTLTASKKNITEFLHQIENLKLHVRRMRSELESGIITTKLDEKNTMNENELYLQISMEEHKTWVFGKKIVEELFHIRNVVGHYDAGQNIIIDKKEYEAYANKIITVLKAFGISVFD